MEKSENSEKEFTELNTKLFERTGPGCKTAEMMAVHRFAESQKPEGERICYDPYAVYFISQEMMEALKKRANDPEKAKEEAEKIERFLPGLSNSIRAKFRYFDDFIERSIDDGIEQLVILGAGYDSRAYRMDGLMGKVKVFEIDHPSAQIVKIEKIKQIFGSLPDRVAYVPVDLGIDDLEQKLIEKGYDKSKKTLFILEGVIFYIPPENVDYILSFIVKNSGKGSAVLFDYFPKSVVDGTSQLEVGINIHYQLIQAGEPMQFGIEEGTVEKFLEERGFSQVCDVTSEDYKRMYFQGVNKDKSVCSLMSFVHAVVR
jgi:methyltransferase (TIGR00027 family)